LADPSFESVQCETETDTILTFTASGISFIQAKSGSLSLGAVRSVLSEFAAFDAEQPTKVRHFILACSGALQGQALVLAERLDQLHHAPEKDRVLDEFAVRELAQGFLVPRELWERVTIERFAMGLDYDSAEQRFVGLLVAGMHPTAVSHSQAVGVFREWMTLLARARGQRGTIPAGRLLDAVARHLGMPMEKLRGQLHGKTGAPLASQTQWSPENGTLRGRIYVARVGQSAGGVLVSVSGSTAQNHAIQITAADGSFEFLDVAPDEYRLTVQAEVPSLAFKQLGRGAPRVMIHDQRQVSIAPGESRVVDVVLADDASLFGVITDQGTALPIRGARVIVGAQSTWTDETGYYSLRTAAGQVDVSVLALGYQDFCGGVLAKNIVTNSGETRFDVQLQVAPLNGALLLGQVTEGLAPRHRNGPPVPGASGAEVQLLGENGKVLASVTIPETRTPPSPYFGNYRFEAVPPGLYRVVASKPGYHEQFAELTITRPSVLWVPDLHLRPLTLPALPQVLEVGVTAESIRPGDSFPIYVVTDIVVAGASVEVRGSEGWNQGFGLEQSKDGCTWSTNRECDYLPGVYSVVAVLVTDTWGRGVRTEYRVNFTVDGKGASD
jgi:hypothetical protein